MIQDQIESRLEIIKPSFKFYEKDCNRLQLKLRGPTSHLFKCYQLKQIPKIKDILANYFPYQENNGIITFDSIIKTSPQDHKALKSILQQFFKKLTICHPPWLREKQQIKTIQQNLKQICSQVKLYVENSPQKQQGNAVYIYFPKNEAVERRIVDSLQFFQRFQNMTVVYSLASFIHKKIENDYRQLFVNKVVQLYGRQIQNLPKKDKQTYKYLIIKNIEAVVINRKQISYTSESWLKQESGGVYGLKIELNGLQYEIIKFYTSLQNFFRKITYCVKESACEIDNFTYIQRKYQHRMLKYFYLNKRQFVIFGPPELFQNAFEEIQKHPWTITRQNYPNMGFQIMKKRERKFRKLLAERRVIYEEMVINQEQMFFLADHKNYEKIKYICRQFMYANLEVQIKLEFIQQRHQFECLKEFILAKQPFSDTIELKWVQDCAYLICGDQRTKDTYNQLKDYYQECLAQMTTILSTKPVDDVLVKVTEISNEFSPDDFIKRRLIFQSLQFQIKFQNLNSCQQKYAIVMAPDIRSTTQLQCILQRNCDISKKQKLQFLEVYQPCKEIKSFIIWNYKNNDHKKRKQWENLDQLRFEGLLKKVCQRSKLVFLVTNQLFHQDFSSFVYLLAQIPHYQQQICRKTTIILSNILESKQKKKIYFQIVNFLRQKFFQEAEQFHQVAEQFYQIRQKDIINISQLKLYQLFYKKDKQTDKLPCSILNSYIFANEKQVIQRNRGLKNNYCGFFLPKNLDLAQILVDLRRMKAYKIQNNKVSDFNLKKIYLLVEMILLIKRMLPRQSFIVLYAQPDQQTVKSALYVYSPQTGNCVKKYILERKYNGQLQFVSSDSFSKIYFRRYDQQTIFQLQTHKKYVQQLRKAIK